ncbi:DNA helicase MCM9-like [Trichogramma pretiosum]|uniref:DNA helicase MCM9-like n=1 Tax=Trichogramma pretiosum TaxID=7493 RepID=UPI0006C9CD60|nr:DNA helicase MCM9-like [Trichogramma pretiosum]
MLKEYFLQYHSEELKEILRDPDEFKIFPIYVDFIHLFEDNPDLADKITKRPRQYLPLCDVSAIEAQEELLSENVIVKKKVRTRIHGIIDTIDQAQIGEMVSMSGFVIRISQPSVTLVAKHLLCKKCQHITIAKLEWEKSKIPDIKECEACKKKSLHHESSVVEQDLVDYQEIKIQDKSCGHTSITDAIQVVLIEDLVDKCTSGDNIHISGYLIRKWGNVAEGQRGTATTFLMANSLLVKRKITESEFCKDEVAKIFQRYWDQYLERPLDGRDNILASICPQLYGMYTLKLALAVVLCGGVAKTNKSGTRVRGDSHLLLCGDPGTGKSQILRTAGKLASRSIMTTGVGTTAAGLTAAAIKDADGWHLEAGALVLANGGVCCIDELTTMSNNDMSSIHEAMEQQTISIAKAGLVSTLNSRCTVIAAINPIGGRFTDGEEVKMRLGGPLLSRFDLLLFLRDKHDPQWDDLVSNHILQAAMSTTEYFTQMTMRTAVNYSTSHDISKRSSEGNDSATENMETSQPGDVSILNTDGLWDEKTLREYFAYVHHFKPAMTKEAERILCGAYMYHRHRDERREERTTVRLMDSLVRLAEGHAKLMYRTQVLMMDAIFATQLINSTNDASKENCRFPTDSMATYKQEASELLIELELDDLIEYLEI